MVVTSGTYEGLPPVAAEFDVTYLGPRRHQHHQWFPGRDRLNL